MKALDLAVEDSEGQESVFISTGDFVDRGPQSKEIIEQLRQGDYKNLKIVVVRGNHEDIMLETVNNPNLLSWWIPNGGGKTLYSYGLGGDDLWALMHGEPTYTNLERDFAWLRELPYWHEDDLRVYVHADLNREKPLEDQNTEFISWNMTDDKTDYGPFFGKHVVHGHMQYEHGPILLENRTNLDTFAWRTGRLAVGVFDNSQAKPIKILEAICT